MEDWAQHQEYANVDIPKAGVVMPIQYVEEGNLAAMEAIQEMERLESELLMSESRTEMMGKLVDLALATAEKLAERISELEGELEWSAKSF